MAKDDPDQFERYRRHLLSQQRAFDLEYEIERWGVSHPQVMSLLTQAFGFGYNPSISIFLGLSPLELNEQADLWASRFRTVGMWMEAFDGGELPRMRLTVRGFTLSESDLQRLSTSVMDRLQSKKAVYWLDNEREVG
jgi:hypothetical protein